MREICSGFLKLVRGVVSIKSSSVLVNDVKNNAQLISDISPMLLLYKMDIFSESYEKLDAAMLADTQRIISIGSLNTPPNDDDVIHTHIARMYELKDEIENLFTKGQAYETNLRTAIYELGQILKTIEECFRRLGFIKKD